MIRKKITCESTSTMDYEAEIKVNKFFGDIWRAFIVKKGSHMQKYKLKIIKRLKKKHLG